MGFKIENRRFANKELTISNEKVQFDADGIGEIQSEDVFKAVLKLNNFVSRETKPENGLEDDKQESSEQNDVDENASEEENASEPIERVKESMSHEKLDERAKELGIFENEDYPTKENKSIKSAYINTEIAELEK